MARTLSNEELTEMVINLNERVERLSQELYELAPEKEAIDTMYDDGAERQAAINAYMNHGEYGA